jgi:anti-anti-sigma factor
MTASFQLELARTGDTAVVMMSGEFDLAAAPELRTLLAQALDAPHVIVDLGAVTFIDSTIIGVLVLAHRAAEQAAVSLTFLPGQPTVMRTLRIAQVDELLGLSDYENS